MSPLDGFVQHWDGAAHCGFQSKWDPRNSRMPARPRFGVMGVAPSEADMVTSVRPHYTGSNDAPVFAELFSALLAIRLGCVP